MYFKINQYGQRLAKVTGTLSEDFTESWAKFVRSWIKGGRNETRCEKKLQNKLNVFFSPIRLQISIKFQGLLKYVNGDKVC